MNDRILEPAADAAVAAEVPLAALTEGILDAIALASLLRDVAECTNLSEIRVRMAHGRLSSGSHGAVALTEVESGLLAGRFVAVQLVYRFENCLWVDTLMTGGAPLGSVRIVRSGTPLGEGG